MEDETPPVGTGDSSGGLPPVGTGVSSGSLSVLRLSAQFII